MPRTSRSRTTQMDHKPAESRAKATLECTHISTNPRSHRSKSPQEVRCEPSLCHSAVPNKSEKTSKCWRQLRTTSSPERHQRERENGLAIRANSAISPDFVRSEPQKSEPGYRKRRPITAKPPDWRGI